MSSPDASGDRRPIAARQWRLTAWLTDRLVRAGVSADGISLAGMVAGLAAGLCLAAAPEQRALWLLAAVLIQLRLLANMLDGTVAIASGTASRLGELFNEIPDRVSDTAILAGLGVAAGNLALGLGAALAAMATAYVRAVGRGLGQASDFCGPGAKQQRMAIVTLAALWCLVAPQQLATPVPAGTVAVVTLLAGVTAIRRLARIARRLAS